MAKKFNEDGSADNGSAESASEQPAAIAAASTTGKPKYRIKSGADTIVYPGLAEYTKDHMEGPNAEMIVTAMKKTDKKKPEWKGNFDKLIEVVQ